MGCRVELNLTLSVVKVITVAWPREETFVAPRQPVDNSHINDRQASQWLLVLPASLSHPHWGLRICGQFICPYQTAHRFRARIHLCRQPKLMPAHNEHIRFVFRCDINTCLILCGAHCYYHCFCYRQRVSRDCSVNRWVKYAAGPQFQRVLLCRTIVNINCYEKWKVSSDIEWFSQG